MFGRLEHIRNRVEIHLPIEKKVEARINIGIQLNQWSKFALDDYQNS